MAKRINANFIQELSARTDLLKLVGLRVDFRRHSGKNHFACCPFHDEQTPSFSVNEAEQFYHCFGCGASGDAIRFLMDYDNLTFVEAVESLAEFNGLAVVYDESSENQQSVARDRDRHLLGLECLAAAAAFFQQAFFADDARHARTYLRERRLNKSIVQQFMIGYAPRGNALLAHLGARYSQDILQAVGLIGSKDGRHYDWFRDRVMFPIRNVRGQVIAFGARALGNAEPKYLNSGESEWFNKRHECYGLYEALNSGQRHRPLLVTEGYMDVVKLAQHGMDNAVAALGTAVGETHISQLKKRAKKIYFAFDGDTAGQKAAAKALEAVFMQHDDEHQWRFIFMPEGEDPDSLVERDGVSAMHALIDASLTASQFLLKLLDEFLGGRDSVEATAALAAYAGEWLRKLPDGAYKALLQREIEQRFSLKSPMLGAIAADAGVRTAQSARRLPTVVSSAPQSMDIRLTAMLVLHPELADGVTPVDYHAELLEALPVCFATCYLLHSGADQALLLDWLHEQALYHDVTVAQQALDGMTAENIADEFADCLRVRNQRILEQRKRLEKLGG